MKLINKRLLIIFGLLIIMVNIANGDFGFVPKQTIITDYPDGLGKYVDSSTIITNKENNSIILELIPSSKVIVEEQNIILQPNEQKTISFIILVDSLDQEEFIQIKQQGKNYGGMLAIKIKGIPNSTLNYTQAIGFICSETKKEIQCLSPLKNVTISKGITVNNNIYIIIGCIFTIISLMLILIIFKKKTKPTIYPEQTI